MHGADHVADGGGDATEVTAASSEAYVRRVLQVTLREGVAPQLRALRRGLAQVVDPAALAVFAPAELDRLLCGEPHLLGTEPGGSSREA